MVEYLWPRAVLRPSSVQLALNERNLATSPAVGGYTQVASSGPPIWSATFGGIDLRTKDQRLCWRALSALIEGRRNIFIVPFCRGDQPYPDGFTPDMARVPHSDGTPHSDGAPYSQKANMVYLASPSLAGSVSLSLSIVIAGSVQPGNYLSINDRLYIVRKSISPTSLEIWPPLRAGVNTGDWVEFDNPTCRMRLASDQEMTVDFQHLRFATANVSFIEDLS